MAAWKVVKHSSHLLTSESQITSHNNLVSLSSSSSSCMCSSLSCRSLSLVYLPSFGGYIFPRDSSPARSISRPEPPPWSWTLSVPLGTGGNDSVVLCMLVLLAYPSTLASAGWKGQAIQGERNCPSFDTVAVSVPNHRLASTGIRTPVHLVGSPASLITRPPRPILKIQRYLKYGCQCGYQDNSRFKKNSLINRFTKRFLKLLIHPSIQVT